MKLTSDGPTARLLTCLAGKGAGTFVVCRGRMMKRQHLRQILIAHKLNLIWLYHWSEWQHRT